MSGCAAYVPRFSWGGEWECHTQGGSAAAPLEAPQKNNKVSLLGDGQCLVQQVFTLDYINISLVKLGMGFFGGFGFMFGVKTVSPQKNMESTQLEVACVLENMIISLGVIPSQDAIRHDTDVSKQKDPKKTDCCVQEIKHFYNVWRYNSFFKTHVRRVRRVFFRSPCSEHQLLWMLLKKHIAFFVHIFVNRFYFHL